MNAEHRVPWRRACSDLGESVGRCGRERGFHVKPRRNHRRLSTAEGQAPSRRASLTRSAAAERSEPTLAVTGWSDPPNQICFGGTLERVLGIRFTWNTRRPTGPPVSLFREPTFDECKRMDSPCHERGGSPSTEYQHGSPTHGLSGGSSPPRFHVKHSDSASAGRHPRSEQGRLPRNADGSRILHRTHLFLHRYEEAELGWSENDPGHAEHSEPAV